jgi:allantoinase
MSPRHYGDILKRQFDQLYLEGQDSGTVMCIPLHAYLVGHPHRIKALEEALKYITSFDDVWVTTAREIADYYYEHYYE